MQEARGCAEVGDALGGEDGEEGLRGGEEGRPVVEDAAGAVEAALYRDEVHDPSGLVKLGWRCFEK